MLTAVLAATTASRVLLVEDVRSDHFIDFIIVIIHKVLRPAVWIWVIFQDSLVAKTYLLSAFKLLFYIVAICIFVPEHVPILAEYALVHHIHFAVALLRINALLLAFYCWAT